MTTPPNRPPAPPRPVAKAPSEEAPLAGLTPTVVETPDGPKAALAVADSPPLPPPGQARRDELARRGDDLAERLAFLEQQLGIDSSGQQTPLMEHPIDRDIARVYDHTQVINPQPGRVYYWANERAAHGIDVTTHKTDGYKVVCGDDPENPEDRDVRGYRTIGDVLLMWIPQEKYDALMERRRRARNALKGSVDSGLMELDEMSRRRNLNVRVSELSPFMVERAAKAAAAQQLAGAITESRLRRGAVPGLARG